MLSYVCVNHDSDSVWFELLYIKADYVSLLTTERTFGAQILRQFFCETSFTVLTVAFLVGRVVILCTTRLLLGLPVALPPQVCIGSPSAEGIALPPLC